MRFSDHFFLKMIWKVDEAANFVFVPLIVQELGKEFLIQVKSFWNNIMKLMNK
jgi:hypothetical protein